MPDWILGIITSLSTAAVLVGGFVGYMRANGSRSGNGVKRSEFTNQVNMCNERFISEAKTNGVVKTSLKNIERRLENIEGWLKK